MKGEGIFGPAGISPAAFPFVASGYAVMLIAAIPLLIGSGLIAVGSLINEKLRGAGIDTWL